ncbi:hypothetical protein L6164_036237 [Bauhinia variegata]|uniref:Uncharacterized protein n=1 Tax=Bauhinia variegata TaxID=167791 RepID=A0ACB9KGE3_BAUVA|nr:hypothetical protein L6164_036237 [Bauhinia variegata]
MFPFSAKDFEGLKESHPKLDSTFWSNFEDSCQNYHRQPNTLKIFANALCANQEFVRENPIDLLYQLQKSICERRTSSVSKEKRDNNTTNEGDKDCFLDAKEFDSHNKVRKQSRITLGMGNKLQKKPMQAGSDSAEKEKGQNFLEGEKFIRSPFVCLMAQGVNSVKEDEGCVMGIQEIEEQKKKNYGSSSLDPNSPPKLPKEFKEKIMSMSGEPNKITLVIEKRLYKTDLQKGNNRISIPFGQISNSEFLETKEIDLLDNQEEMSVPLIHKPTTIKGQPVEEPKIIETIMKFKQWDMPKNDKKKSSQYVLISKWMEVAEQNGLKVGDKVQIWAFRGHEDNLCLALVIVERANDDTNQKKIK